MDVLERAREAFERPLLDGVVLVDGYGVQVKVERSALVVKDGIGTVRRERRWERGDRSLRRVVLLNPQGGSVSLDALQWLEAQGVAVASLNGRGRPRWVTTWPAKHDAPLRRAQALALGTELGLELARYLLEQKVKGQGDVLLSMTHGIGERSEVRTLFKDLRVAILNATDMGMIEAVERNAAKRYWRGWVEQGIAVSWAARDRGRVPDHWKAFPGREALWWGNQRAPDPINACLNYLYGCLESETSVALLAAGLDLELGLFHVDQEGRDSFVYDVMEVARPAADAILLDLLRHRTFRKSELAESPAGEVALLVPLTHELAQHLPTLAAALPPHVDHLRALFA